MIALVLLLLDVFIFFAIVWLEPLLCRQVVLSNMQLNRALISYYSLRLALSTSLRSNFLMSSTPRQLNPKKLLNSKWTAVMPIHQEKHFMVTKCLVADLPLMPLESIELEAVYSRRKQILPWQTLTDTDMWLQGWL